LFSVKNANFFAEFFGENIFKIITSVHIGRIFAYWATAYLRAVILANKSNKTFSFIHQTFYQGTFTMRPAKDINVLWLWSFSPDRPEACRPEDSFCTCFRLRLRHQVQVSGAQLQDRDLASEIRAAFSPRPSPPVVDFMKPFWPKFTDKTYLGQI
jgi:hypothetical protein